jgi:outer membrane protein
MKQISKAFFFIAIATLCSLTISAQRYAYVDTDYILKNLESYQDAQKELDRISSQWQKEIEQRYEAIDRLYKAYQAEKVLLTEDMRKEREDEIIRQEEEAKALQRQRFGVDGDLFRRREELIQPIQEEVFQAIKQVADGGGFSVIFDKAGQSNILYADPRYDKSDRVLSRLGVSASDREDSDESDRDSGTDTRQEQSKDGQSPRR